MSNYTNTVEYAEIREQVSEEIKQKVREAAQRLSGIYHESRKGVPLIILPWDRKKASLCWFQKGKRWKFFWPWPSNGLPQTKADFKTLEHFMQWYHITCRSRSV